MARALPGLALALVALCAPAAAADGPSGSQRAELELARARWAVLTDQEKAELRSHWRRFQRLDEGSRAELIERARRLRETSQRVQGELPPDARARLRGLSPHKRREVLRDIVEGQARQMGQRIREQIPDEWVRRLESAAPEQRPGVLAKFKQTHVSRIANFALEKVGERLGLTEEEVGRLKALPIDERTQAVLDLRKQLTEQDARTVGLPPFLTPEQWEELQRLEPEAFFQRLQEQRRRYESAQRARGEGLPGATPDLPVERREALLRLADAVRERPEDWLDLADLDAEERRERVFEQKRERILAVLREQRLLAEPQLQRLAARDEKRFFEVIRHLLQPLRATGWGVHGREWRRGERGPR